MPTAAREAILDAMVTKLRVIGTSSAFSSTQQPTVSRTKHPSVNLPTMPWVYVGAESEDYERTGQIGAAGTYDRVMHVEIFFVFSAPNMDEAASRVIHDVEYALRDWEIGDTANDLTFTRYEVEASTEGETMAVVTFYVDVSYRTDDNAPATRV